MEKKKSGPCVPAPVRVHFGDVSSRWADRYGAKPRGMADLDLILRRRNAQRFMRTIIGSSDRRLTVLDIGCGTGNGLDGISRQQIRVLGVDAVPEMLEIAAREHPEDQFLQTELEHLPLDDGYADVILCLGVLEYVNGPDVALQSIGRVLRPGGHLIVSFPNGRSLFRKFSRFTIGVEETLSRVLHVVRRVDQRGKPETRYKHTRWSPGEAVTLLERNGFINPCVVFNTFGMWGRLGRLRVNKDFSAWASSTFGESRILGGWFACTMVIHVQKLATH